jgi:hypothetical protein
MFDLLRGQGRDALGTIEPNAQRGIGGLGLFKRWQVTSPVNYLKSRARNELCQ